MASTDLTLDSLCPPEGKSNANHQAMINDLWSTAEKITPAVDEQALLVALAVRAGKDAEWLNGRVGVTPAKQLGLFNPDGSIR